jgi:hypothetical protein
VQRAALGGGSDFASRAKKAPWALCSFFDGDARARASLLHAWLMKPGWWRQRWLRWASALRLV